MMRRSRWRWRWAWLGLVAAAGIRELACGGSDDGSAGPPQSDAGSEPDAAPTTANPDTSDADPGPPSYCNGIIFYTDFENGFAPVVGDILNPGDGGVHAVGSASIAPGHFGSAASFLDGGGPEGSAVFYDDRRDSGPTPIVSRDEGSAAFWYRAVEPPAPATPLVVIRPLVNAGTVVTAGPVIERYQGTFGLFVDLTGPSVVTLQESAMVPFLRAGDFNHFVVAWKAAIPDAGAKGFALVAVNGALGERLGDGGTDASIPDASPDEAGHITTPYLRTTTTTTATSYPTAGSLRFGGSTATYPRGNVDDVALWNRVLTAAEISALYQSTEPIRARCRLP